MGSPGAVILGGYINALGIVRALGQREIPTAVVTTRPFDIAHRSRWCRAGPTLSWNEERSELLLELLARQAFSWKGWALYPTNDWALAALAQHRDRLLSSYRVISPPAEVAAYFLDKRLLQAAAAAVGVDQPRYYGPAADGMASFDRVPFPVLVKPFSGHRFFARFGCKLVQARDAEELERCLALVTDAGIECGVHDFIPGPDSGIVTYTVYIDQRGEPRGGLAIRKLRQSPPIFGVARLAELTTIDEGLREGTLEILRRIGFRGMATAEFKRDPRDNSFRLLEINGRSVLYNALLRRGGFDTAALAWSDVVERHPRTAEITPWPGLWRNAHADILYSLRDRDSIPLRGLVARDHRPRIDAVWSVRDPLPSLAQWSQTAVRGMAALRSGTWRDLFGSRAHALAADATHDRTERGARETTARNLPPPGRSS